MSIKKQTLWSMLPLLVVTLVNLISIPLFYRYLGAEMYALWFYVLSLSGSFGFADLGLGVAIGRYVGVELGRGDMDAARSYWATGNAVAIPLLALMSLFFTIAGAVYGPRWFNVAPDKMSILQWAFVAAGPGLFFSFYGQFWNILAQVHLDFKFVSLLRVSLNLVQVGGSIVLAAATRNALVLVMWASLLSIVQLGFLMQHARRKYLFGLHWQLTQLARIRDMAGYTTKTFLTLVVNNVLVSIDRLVLGRFAAPTDFARYTICSNAGSRISGLSVAIMGPIFGQSSRAVGAGGGEIAQIYEEAFDLLFGWLTLAAVWAIVWKHALLRLWLGPELGSTVEPLLPPLIVAYCLTSMTNISGAQLGPLNRVGAGLLIHVIAGALVVICVYLGWQWAGVVGVAYGFLISRSALVLQDFFVIRLTNARGWLAPSRWLHLGAQIATAAAFWLLVFVLKPALPLQLGLALLHGSLVALYLVRKEIPAWLALLFTRRVNGSTT
jgi:O-antigen/teichoic acid export membrane protein